MAIDLALLRFQARELFRNFAHERGAFERQHGYRPNLRNPRSLSEKIVARKLFDRNPLLARVQDKVAVRSYVAEKLQDKADALLIPTIAVTRDPEAIPFDRLPEQYVLKPSHLSGKYFIKRPGRSIDKAALITMARDWLTRTHGRRSHEWAYRKMPKQIIVEQLLEMRPGVAAEEYSLHMFAGALGVIEHFRNPHDEYKNDAGQATRTFYDAGLNRLAFTWGDYPGIATPIDHSEAAIAFMRRCAETLSEAMDYVRVDFYICSDGVRIGEMTIYPGGGMDRIDPVSHDYELGARWLQDFGGAPAWSRIFCRD